MALGEVGWGGVDWVGGRSKGGRKLEGVVSPPRLACPDVGLGWHTVRTSMLAVWRVGTLPGHAAAEHIHGHTHTRTHYFLSR